MGNARFLIVETRLGPAALVGGKAGIVRVVLPGDREKKMREAIARWFPAAVEDPRGLVAAGRAVSEFFASGRPPRRSVRLDLTGVTAFRGAVYAALREVEPGRTVSYAEVARRIGRSGACRAVGAAVAANPVPLFVPCHRVVRSDGGLGGFTAPGGLSLKREMLRLEGSVE